MTAPASPPRRGIVGYSPELDEEILRFQRLGWPDRRAEWVEPRWRWMFLASARRVGVDPMVWFYRNRDGIVAQQGGIAVKVRVLDREYATGWFVETMALESVRGKAIGPMLVAKALEDLPLNLSLGQTAQMRELQFRLGWTQVAPLPRLALVLNARAVAAAKLPNPLARAAGRLALGAAGAVRRLRAGPRPSWTPEVEEPTHFGAEYDQLWADVGAAYPCAVVRDASYLAWKYVDQPGQQFVRIAVRRGGHLVSFVALQILEPDDAYRYRRGMVIELVAPAADADVQHATFSALRHAAADHGVDMLVLDLLSVPLENAARRYGFVPREPARVFLVSPGPLEEPYRAAFTDAGSWLVTAGDSDIDRPW